jgi:protein phosphatase
MGTTLAAAALVVGGDGRDAIALANVGDSRAYLYTAGQLSQITNDHSLAEEKVRYGELTEAEAAIHPHRHILTRALGVAPDVEVDLWELHLRTGDRLLLCSDGLTNEVPVTRIAQVLGAEPDPEAVARLLVQAANDHGGNDNITVLLVDVLVGDDDVATHDVVAPRSGTDRANGALGPAAAAAAAGTLGAVVPPVRTDLTGMGPAVGASAGPPVGTALPVATVPMGSPTLAPGQVAPGHTTPDVVPSVPPPMRARSASPRGETRGERRRRLGIPRRVTFRVIFFLILLAAVVAAAYFVVRWYATDNWFVTVQKGELVVYQGRPGGLLWFEPKLVDHTGVPTSDVLSLHLGALRRDVQQPSLNAAKHYVQTLQQEAFSQRQINAASPTTTAPPTTAPPPTSAPPATSTTTASPPATTAWRSAGNLWVEVA